MTALTVQQVAKAASDAGFRGDSLVMAVAIAKRESGWDPSAVGDIDNPAKGHRSIGLMQINVGPSYNNAGVWFRENPDVLLDPVQNMKAAYEMSGGGTNWRPWSTYRAGIPAPDLDAIRRQLDGTDLSTVADPTAGPTTVGLPNPLDAIGGITDFMRKLTAWSTWLRILQIGGGVLLIGWGASAMANDALRATIMGSVKTVKTPNAAPDDDNDGAGDGTDEGDTTP